MKTELPTYLSDENQAKRSSGRRFCDVFIDLRPELIYDVRGVEAIVGIVVTRATSSETWGCLDDVSVAVGERGMTVELGGHLVGHVYDLVCWHRLAR